jgi:CAAX prenyl protease-like protein
MQEALPRIIPYALYVGFVFLGVALGALAASQPGAVFDARWLYPLQAGAAAAAVAYFWRRYDELREARPSAGAVAVAVAVGLGVFAVWAGLDVGWATFGDPRVQAPLRDDGTLDWTLVAPRLIGAALVVPIVEELFWRSFVMRWLDRTDFPRQDPRHVGWRAFAMAALVYGFAHSFWVAGIVAGLAYGWLYARTANLWAPIIAHAVANIALGAWMVHRGSWQYW